MGKVWFDRLKGTSEWVKGKLPDDANTTLKEVWAGGDELLTRFQLVAARACPLSSPSRHPPLGTLHTCTLDRILDNLESMP